MTSREQAPWINRRFVFDLPVGMFPNILERLRGTPARLAERLAGLEAAKLTRCSGDSWSIQENVGHLIAVEGLWLGRLDDFAAGLEQLRPADMTNRRTEEADYNIAVITDLLEEFRSVRSEFVQRLKELPAVELVRSAHHPRLDQPMRVLDLMVFAAEHDDHHLARITGLLEGN